MERHITIGDTKIPDSTLLVTLTIREFDSLMKSYGLRKQEKEPQEVHNEGKYIRGYAAMATKLGVSTRYIGKLVGNGTFTEAIIRRGKVILFDTDLAINLFKEKGNKRLNK
ncbi:hypothetical protein EZS27_016960 [termite gut metagenome]|uniref:DUF3853 family protein n=1 Tax=termite gut metagenome TaxID=433724 RepID=A0A5J4RMF9_9ZZZZ